MQSAPENAETDPTGTAPLVVVVTGMSGAGRTTAIKVLEDLGYEAINNLPLTFFDALIAPVAGTSSLRNLIRPRGLPPRRLSVLNPRRSSPMSAPSAPGWGPGWVRLAWRLV